jgi:DNA-binding CsgD family transcriptional regulator/nitrogen fixation-related uncharacterized protein
MSFPYEGPVMYALAGERGINAVMLNTLTVFLHFAGLFSGRYLAKDIVTARRNIVLCTGSTLFLSLFIPVIPVDTWVIVIPIVSYLTGIVIASNGHMLKRYIPSDSRTRAVADLLIYGNIVLIAAHIFANNTTPEISFVFIEILLVVAFIAALKIDIGEKPASQPILASGEKSAIKDYWIFFLFIFIITINAGIMFQVIYPYFGEFALLTSIYTNIPYIISVYLLSRVLKVNKFYFLYVGLALWSVTFILFAILGQTAVSFLLICSVMLFAAGVFDLFWWSIMANNFDNVKNPSSLFGLGLSFNVLGVWVGGLIGNYVTSIDFGKQALSHIGLLVVTISILIILPLNNKLSSLLEYNEFLVKFTALKRKAAKSFFDEVENILTKREFEVFNLLISGKTDTQISEILHISSHTIKTHNRNIYKKLNVSNRVELIEKIPE